MCVFVTLHISQKSLVEKVPDLILWSGELWLLGFLIGFGFVFVSVCFLYLPDGPLEAGDEETTRGLNEFQSKKLGTHDNTFLFQKSPFKFNLN